MRARLRLAAVVALSAATFVRSAPAQAEAGGTATISDGGVWGTVGATSGSPGAGQRGGPYVPVDSSSPIAGYGGASVLNDSFGGAFWEGTGQTGAQQIGCAGGQGSTVPGSTAPLGSVLYVLVSNQGVPVTTDTISCAPGPKGAGVIPPPPPPPPTGTEVWAAASNWEPLVSSGIGANPSTLGLTGLSSWFWLTNPTTTLPILTVGVGGYTVTASASIASYTWTFGDGDSATAYSPGSANSPAATYTYQAKGRYHVTVIAHYVGSYTFSGFGIAPQKMPLAIDVTMGTLSYGVQEIRSVLIYPGAS